MRKPSQKPRVGVLVRPLEFEDEVHRRLARIEEIDNRRRVLLRPLHVLVKLRLELRGSSQALRALRKGGAYIIGSDRCLDPFARFRIGIGKPAPHARFEREEKVERERRTRERRISAARASPKKLTLC